MTYRFHIVGLPHTKTSREYMPCAYSQKVVNFAKMMRSLGHTVFLYAGEGSDADADEIIPIITKEERQKWWGANDWTKQFFAIDFNVERDYWKTANNRAIEEIGKRIQPRDFICLIGGNCQKPVADAFPENMSVEFGIGYDGTFSKYRVFESYAWMHYVYGKHGATVGNSYDTVIPNYFNPDDFKLAEKEDYFLFVGRLIKSKGLEVAADAARRMGKRLIVAGQGAVDYRDGVLKCQGFDVPGVEYVGTVDAAQRAELMSKAKAVFCLTEYIGPFEGVHVEALLSGTPVITTDWGVFSETVKDGFNGFRCRTMGEILWAAEAIVNNLTATPRNIRKHAVERFSVDNIRYRYQDYFDRLMDLWGEGWYCTDYEPATKRLLGNFS